MQLITYECKSSFISDIPVAKFSMALDAYGLVSSIEENINGQNLTLRLSFDSFQASCWINENLETGLLFDQIAKPSELVGRKITNVFVLKMRISTFLKSIHE